MASRPVAAGGVRMAGRCDVPRGDRCREGDGFIGGRSLDEAADGFGAGDNDRLAGEDGGEGVAEFGVVGTGPALADSSLAIRSNCELKCPLSGIRWCQWPARLQQPLAQALRRCPLVC